MAVAMTLIQLLDGIISSGFTILAALDPVFLLL